MWCPFNKDIRLKPCPRPPTRVVLIDAINDAIGRKISEAKKLQYVSAARLPEHSWLLAVLSTIEGDHPIFAKGYTPEKSKDPLVGAKIEHLRLLGRLNHKFFAGLPEQLLVRRKSLKHAQFFQPHGQPQVSL